MVLGGRSVLGILPARRRERRARGHALDTRVPMRSSGCALRRLRASPPMVISWTAMLQSCVCSLLDVLWPCSEVVMRGSGEMPNIWTFPGNDGHCPRLLCERTALYSHRLVSRSTSPPPASRRSLDSAARYAACR